MILPDPLLLLLLHLIIWERLKDQWLLTNLIQK